MAGINGLNYLILILLALGQLSRQQSCKKLSSCSCKSANGIIDLSPLAKTGGPKYLDKPGAKGEWLYSWNPCKEFTEGLCSEVAGCQVSPTKGAAYNSIGKQDSATFSDDSGNQVITYKDKTDILRTLKVTLICDESKEGDLYVAGEGETAEYSMTLTSKYACLGGGGISPGSILLIIFFVAVILYLIGGVVFQAGIRKATGKEMVPNYPVWSTLPGLIKDGFMFTFTCGRRGTVYSKI